MIAASGHRPGKPFSLNRPSRVVDSLTHLLYLSCIAAEEWIDIVSVNAGHGC